MIDKSEIELSLEEIIQSNDFVLFDTSILSSESHILNSLYNIKYFNQLDSKILREIKNEEDSILKLIEILKNNKMYTVKQVTNEIKRYCDILGKKISELNESAGYISKNKNFTKICNRNYIADNIYVKKSSLHNLQNVIFSFYKNSKKNEYDIKDKRYEILLKMA